MDSLEKLATRYPQRRVLITGATSGLGEALAQRFACGGFRVAVASRNPAKVADTVKRLEQAGGQALAITLDVTRVEDFQAALETVESVPSLAFGVWEMRSRHCPQWMLPVWPRHLAKSIA